MNGIKLRLLPIENTASHHLHGFRMRIEAYDAPDDLTNYVFVCRRHPVNPHTGEVVDEFYTIVSFPHIAMYPVGAPDPDKGWPFFRRDWFELDISSTQQYEETWELVKSQVCHFETAYRKAAANLQLLETFWIGDAPDTSSSI